MSLATCFLGDGGVVVATILALYAFDRSYKAEFTYPALHTTQYTVHTAHYTLHTTHRTTHYTLHTSHYALLTDSLPLRTQPRRPNRERTHH